MLTTKENWKSLNIRRSKRKWKKSNNQHLVCTFSMKTMLPSVQPITLLQITLENSGIPLSNNSNKSIFSSFTAWAMSSYLGVFWLVYRNIHASGKKNRNSNRNLQQIQLLFSFNSLTHQLFWLYGIKEWDKTMCKPKITDAVASSHTPVTVTRHCCKLSLRFHSSPQLFRPTNIFLCQTIPTGWIIIH